MVRTALRHQHFRQNTEDLELVGCDEATGRPLLRAPPPFDPTGQTAAPDTAAIILRLAENGAVDTVARLPKRATPQDALSPFMARTMTIIGAGEMYVIDTDTMAVRTFSGEGRLLRIARVPHSPRPVTREDNQRAIDAMLTGVPDGFADQIRDRYEHATPPDVMPAVRGVVVDAAGRVWLQPYTAPWEDPATDWVVLGPDGALAGVARLPPGLEPREFGEDWVLGEVRDEFDVSYVRIYRLVPPARDD